MQFFLFCSVFYMICYAMFFVSRKKEKKKKKQEKKTRKKTPHLWIASLLAY